VRAHESALAIAGSQVSGAVSTASALAANGLNCPEGQAPLGVDAQGNAEGCWTPSSDSLWGVSGSNIYRTSGNVLVGTSSDNGTDRLQVTGSIRSNVHISADQFRLNGNGKRVQWMPTNANHSSLNLDWDTDGAIPPQVRLFKEARGTDTTLLYLNITSAGHIKLNNRTSITAPTASYDSETDIGAISFVRLSNTQLQIRVKGSDGVTRSATLTLN
jgi:hypothetical protein